MSRRRSESWHGGRGEGKGPADDSSLYLYLFLYLSMDMTKDELAVLISTLHGAVPRIVPQIAGRIVYPAACGTTGEIVWRATRSAAFPAARKAVCRATGKAESEAQRGVAVERTLRTLPETVFSTLHDTAFSVAPRAYLGAMPQPVPQSIRGVVPRAGVLFSGLKPKASSPKHLGRKADTER